MNSDVLLIVLTENCWLYNGFASLLPEMDCMMLEFSSKQLPDAVRKAGRVIVVVDTLIFFRGEWESYNYLKLYRPDTLMFWLSREETGCAFPVKSRGERVLNHKQDILSLRNALLGRPEKKEYAMYVRPTNLTLTERILLPSLFSGMDAKLLSRITGKSVKTLYSHRQKILAKTGFRQASFLQFVYNQNHGLPCLQEMISNTK
ncbi:helix-turn-helix transcriptional regulator [Enterobacter cancerogenus]|uniref:helix-turn-helix transcriptional regulator n=1 Tax=Enterobacter cancerogenus TaxID=69218 RepID=UPI004057FFF1